MNEPAAPGTPEVPAPSPAGSRWGRRVATVYLALAGLSFALLFYELAAGQRGLGSIAISVLTAPWSAALALLAQSLGGALPEAAMRVLGFALAGAAALLNARILYGMAARAERDARGGR
jgi:hypothetical protein